MSDTEVEQRPFQRCTRCRVKRPISQLDIFRTSPTSREFTFRCCRVEHCDALLRTGAVENSGVTGRRTANGGAA